MPVKSAVVFSTMLIVAIELIFPPLVAQWLIGNGFGIVIGLAIGILIFLMSYQSLRIAVKKSYKTT
jgi:hypothetical protein